MQKARIRVDSAGLANAINFHKTKAGNERAWGCNYFSRAPEQGGNEYVAKGLSGEINSVLRPLTALNVVHTNFTGVPSTKAPASNTEEPITECAATLSVVCFCISSLYTGIHVTFAQNSDETITKFYAWVLAPFCGTSLLISFLLKPRREDLTCKAFLYLQFFLFTFVKEVLTMVGYEWQQDKVLALSLRCLV